MINSDDSEYILNVSINECRTKLGLILDYFERFKISDVRILSPVQDIEKCIDIMTYALNENESGEF